MTAMPYRPVLFDRSNPADRDASARVQRDPSTLQLDTLPQQLADLAQARSPSVRLTGVALEDAVARLHGGTPDHFGYDVFFPWAHKLVRLLPPAEFAELRADRNRDKITREETAWLATRKIAIAGLSVGSAIATTLAMEGVGGHFHLADFDTLGLSNLNRLLGSVTELGVPKVVLAARRLYELNPYVHVQVFTEGVTAANVDDFLEDVSLLVEECDSLPMKVRLRESARRSRIPVLMETSDRGMLDIERFDCTPDRPLLHGLMEGIEADALAGMSPAERLALVLRILGPTMSEQMTKAMGEVGRTQETWPQLASAVTLGGATATHAARLILLGKQLSSGRYFVDLDQLLASPVSMA